ncbi:MAG: DUF222 domain-containing protein [Proteobacteria bacterium]|nr:DUF222 domain-containing protein [Pseudomonadota bacterium]
MSPANSARTKPISIDELDHAIVSCAARINAATYEMLLLVRQFDERAGFLQWGLDNCAEWLAWRCDLSLVTAKEKLRTAHALKSLPAISGAFSEGELSYTKVRELTRVANRDNEENLLDFALRTTATIVAQRCRELRMGDEASIDTAARAFANRSLRIRRDPYRGTMVVTVELPMESGELLEKALDKARDDEVLETPDPADTSWSARQADAFVNMVTGFLSGTGNDAENNTRSNDNYLVTIHVDQSALQGKEGRSALPIETVKRLCCDGPAVALIETEKSEPLSIGRKSRIIPKAIERAVRARDNNCCRFPGCHNHRFLHCHHVEHWSRNGETSLDNLMLLCTKHHTLVHEGGFRIETDFQDNWYFVRPDGIAVPEAGYHSRDMLDTDAEDVSTLYNNPPAGVLNPPAGALLSVAENFVKEPPAPVYLH